jgi:GTP-binding protein
MKNFNAEFVAGVTSATNLPKFNLPEFAFTGRSNVGKSSLLNCIVHRKNLAHTSSSPGKTQQINFYKIEEKWMLVDCPGFGFASVSKDKRNEWLKLIYYYLEKREKLKIVFALIDSRHDPLDSDLGIIEWLENNNKKFIIVLTKCDKLSQTQINERKAQLEELVANCTYCSEVLPFSAVTNLGRNDLLAIIKKSL